MSEDERDGSGGLGGGDTGCSSDTGSARYPFESDDSAPDSTGYPAESAGLRTESAGYPLDSDDSPRGSDGSMFDSERDQTDSDGSQSSARTPSSGSGDREPPDFVKSLARAAAQKERDERRRAPGTWMPGAEDLDRDPQPGDDTQFGTDGPPREYISRQIGIRLRPQHFERLLDAARLYGVRPTTMARMMIVRGINAIHDAELRARARELKDAGSE